jgi:hypothetical protein
MKKLENVADSVEFILYIDSSAKCKLLSTPRSAALRKKNNIQTRNDLILN